MANEATVRVSLQIRKTSGSLTVLEWLNRPGAFQADVTGTKGPTPGALTIPVGGKVISLEELGTPGLCHLRNCDATNYVEWGVYDVDQDRFYPVGELLPGEGYVLRLSRNIQEEYEGTGTGTSGPTSRLFMKANTADVVVVVSAFEA
jgi:hypothetical protein